MHVVVAIRQAAYPQRRKDSRLVAAEIVRGDQVERRAASPARARNASGVVPAATVGDLLGRQAEQEEVLLAGFLRHFDRRSVARADGQRAVHHELHVAGAAGFVAGGRNLVGDVAAGISRSARDTQ